MAGNSFNQTKLSLKKYQSRRYYKLFGIICTD